MLRVFIVPTSWGLFALVAKGVTSSPFIYRLESCMGNKTRMIVCVYFF